VVPLVSLQSYASVLCGEPGLREALPGTLELRPLQVSQLVHGFAIALDQ